jgi:deoxyhypusine synthase
MDIDEKRFEKVKEAVLVPSDKTPESSPVVKGYDFNRGVNWEELVENYKYIGFQATNFGRAVDEINKMIKWRLSDEPIDDDDWGDYRLEDFRKNVRCTIFLGYTSNLISSGLRDIIRYLVQHQMVDCIVTTAGGIEEDLIKCMAPTFVSDFHLPGAELRKKGLNRIGNLIVPNDNYCKFEDWIMPIFNQMLEEQKTRGEVWCPSKVIARMGKEINNEESVYYWAYRVCCSPPPSLISSLVTLTCILSPE